MSALDGKNGTGRKPEGGKTGSARGYEKKADGSSRPARPARPYGKSADGADRPSRPYVKKAERPDGADRPARPARPYGKSADSADRPARPARPYGKSADSADRPARPYGKSADGADRPARPARPYGKSADSAGRPSRPYVKKPDRPNSADRPARPARPYGKSATPPVEAPNARFVALQTLLDVHRDGAYAQLALQKRLAGPTLASIDHRFITSLVYATIENQLRIDFALDRLVQRPVEEPEIRDILRLSACQLFFMDRVPESAAVNEGVKLCRAVGMDGSAGFVNAVLRNLIRGKDEIPWPKREDDLQAYLSVMGSMPMWIVDKLLAAYPEEAEAIVMDRRATHETVVRPNMMLFDDAAFEDLLNRRGYPWRRGVAPHAYRIENAGDLAHEPGYRDGHYSIQGESSMLAAEAVQACPGMRVLDACAAPGGKASYLAERMQNTGRVYAWELHEKRALLLESAKRRLKLDNLRVSVRDALDPRPDLTGTLDAVLLDAPCSGLGVMVEKPDIKYRVQPGDVPAIVDTQRRLLDALCGYVKPNGVLVYSTCSILPEENREQIAAFLERRPDFVVEPLPLSYPESFRLRQTELGLQLLGCRDGVEGFYIVRMRRARA